jgi:hypothetical protein
MYFRMTMVLLLVFLSSSFCKKEEKNDDRNILAMALVASGTGGAGSSLQTAGPTVAMPSVLTGASASVSGQILERTVITDTEAKKILKGTYAPVRASIYVVNEVTKVAKNLIETIETDSFISKLTSEVSGKIEDKNDKVSTTKYYRFTPNSTTFGSSGGKKLEFWWGKNTASTVPDLQVGDVKQLELHYHKTGTETTDGVIFFRFKQANSNYFTTVRAEYKKDAGGLKTNVIHIEDLPDSIYNNVANKGRAAVYLTEDTAGTVTVDGGIEYIGLKRPITNDNTDAGWTSTTSRVYVFNAVGSPKINKAVIKVVLPLATEDISTTDAFAEANSYSLGNLYTQSLLNQWNTTTISCGTSGTVTTLACVNSLNALPTCSGTALTTSSSQTELSTALAKLDSCLPSANKSDAWLKTLQGVVGIKNPVYFIKTSATTDDDTTNYLVGQENTEGFEKLSEVGSTGVTEYKVLEANANFARKTVRTGSDGGGDFSPKGIKAISIANGTSITPISGHPTSIAKWTGANGAIPTLTTASGR